MTTVPRNQTHLASLLGVAKSCVSTQVKRGMPITSLEEALAWRKENLRPARVKGTRFDQYRRLRKVSTQGDTGIAPEKSLVGVPGVSDETQDEARTRREISEADLSEMKRAEQRGELIRVDAVTTALGRVFSKTRDSLLQIPARLAPLLAADTEPASVQNILHTEIHQALQELAGASDRLWQSPGEIVRTPAVELK